MKDDDDCRSVLFNRRHVRIDRSVMLAKPTSRGPRDVLVLA